MMLARELYRGQARDVILMPDARLKQICEKVIDISVAQIAVLDDLIETMLALPRCVGLAAPQIGSLERIAVVDVSRHPKAPRKNHGLLCMINPEILLTGGMAIGREGCVSVPGFTANVERAENVAVSYLDLEGREQIIESFGFEAVALQHEIDHLDGKLFLDRATVDSVFARRP